MVEATGGQFDRAAGGLSSGATQHDTVALPTSASGSGDVLHTPISRGKRPRMTSGDVQGQPPATGGSAADGAQGHPMAKGFCKRHLGIDYLAARLSFGPSSLGPLHPSTALASACVGAGPQQGVEELFAASMPKFEMTGRSRRKERVMTDITRCLQEGLKTNGPATSAVNREIIQALQYIMFEMEKRPPKDIKRVSCFKSLVEAFKSCQPVQARCILRMFGDLTSKENTFEGQLKYSLVREKEAALNRYISLRHPGCDWTSDSHRHRLHLLSGYLFLIGDRFGLDGAEAAKHDCLLAAVVREIGHVAVDDLIAKLQRDLSVKEWLQTLLADINNQAQFADRIIRRDCIYEWALENMGPTARYDVYYDADRAEEFAGQDPQEPTAENIFQPFLSCKVLVDILVAAAMLQWNTVW
eukprot:CAMPEP_0117512566 /NCGR_PEP_ID=MMETSP0784-20121206/29096_1 /TAXON_ID=39447 /ORGANISM="" /LENGTH=412 /DNA_ID=CAMNT_0005308287 /DNA_START=1 /DNA_END=1236 /DNA_ORIENTATION=+